MSTVNTVLTSAKYDRKISTDDTGRDAEFIEYINSFNTNVLLPLFIDYQSDYGRSEWYTAETAAYDRIVAQPTNLKCFDALYCIDDEHSGTAASGASTTITLDSDASDSDDAYNGYYVRVTGGTGSDQQKRITDYTGSTVTATVDSTWDTNPDSTSTFIIFKPPSEDNRLDQVSLQYLIGNYSDFSQPEAYAIDGTNIYLGNTPDDIYALQGWYYADPTDMSASTDTLPYSAIFDDLARSYVGLRAQMRDEYNSQVEIAMMEKITDDILTIILGRGHVDKGSVSLKGVED